MGYLGCAVDYVHTMIAATLNSATRSVPPWVLYPLLAIPGVWLFVSEALNPSPDPVAALEHGLGEYALQLLVLGLLITPLRDGLRVNFVRYRRQVGLMAFFYVVAHLLVYLVLDNQFWWDALIKDFTKRPYIIVGMVSFVILIPLALTSNNTAIRKLGPIAWKRLHYLTYPAIFFGSLHYVMLEKTWQTEPLIYLAVAVILVAWRVPRLLGVRWP
ncbi:MAG: protein-methionine-sulfoxide reductase heme-binding subunit MsrQ [Pseudomonadota bacterium]